MGFFYVEYVFAFICYIFLANYEGFENLDLNTHL